MPNNEKPAARPGDAYRTGIDVMHERRRRQRFLELTKDRPLTKEDRHLAEVEFHLSGREVVKYDHSGNVIAKFPLISTDDF